MRGTLGFNNVGTPEDALDAMAAGVDFIDGSFAVRAAYTGAALLLRECDRGQASAQAPNQSEQTQSSALPQYEPVLRHAAQLSSAPPWRRGPADAAAHQELGGKVVLDRNNKRPPHAASRETSVHRESQAKQSESAPDGAANAADLKLPAAQSGEAGSGTFGTSGSSSGVAHSIQPAEGTSATGHSQQASRGSSGEAQEWGADDTTMDLHSLRFRQDTRPLSSSCPCHTCSHHTRAYIHHLLNVNEMLAQVRAALSHVI